MAMIEAGSTYEDVARALGVTRGAVAGFRFRAKLPGIGRRRKLSPEAVAAIKGMLVDGRRQWELAYIFGVTQTTISKIKRGLR
jgi:transcriptional regulator with XRE-family HTH domain